MQAKLFTYLTVLLLWPGLLLPAGRAPAFAPLRQTPPEVAPAAPTDGTYTLAIPAAAFTPTFYAADYENHGRYIKNFPPLLSEYFRAPVQLPHGATVSEVKTCFYDDFAAHDATLKLYRLPLAGDGPSIAMASLTSATSAGYIVRQTSQIPNPVIDNANFTYYLYVGALMAAETQGSNVWGCGAWITYTLPAVATHLVSIPGAAFMPVEDGYNTDATPQKYGYLMHYYLPDGSSQTGTYTAPVHLPHGAVVTKMTLHYNEVEASKTIYARLRNTSAAADWSDVNMAEVSSLDWQLAVSDTSITDATIDNFSKSYWLALALPPNTGSAYYVAVYGVTLEYTLPASDDNLLALAGVTLPPAAFQPFSNAYDYLKHTTGLYHLHGEGGDNSAGMYVAPLNLPDGVFIRYFLVNYAVGSGDTPFSATLARSRLGYLEEMETLEPGGVNWIGGIISDQVAHAQVDNTQYNYYVYWTLPASTLPPPPGSDDWLGISITVLYTEAVPVYLPMTIK